MATRGEFYIQQPGRYSAENHEAWRRLYRRLRPRWEKYANERFLAGLPALGLSPDKVPRLDEINRRLGPLTGFQAKAVSGYIPAFVFFDCLVESGVSHDRYDSRDRPAGLPAGARHFPRRGGPRAGCRLDPAFAGNALAAGRMAHTAAAVAADIPGEATRLTILTSIVRALARFFWFTIEFGLMQGPDGLRVAKGCWTYAKD